MKLTKLLILVLLWSTSLYADGVYEDKVSSNSSSSSSSLGQGKQYSLSAKELLKYQYCGKDSDCMAVINGCCQCIQGDPYVAINKDSLEAFKSKFYCEDVLCPKEESTFACEDGVVSCVSHKCKYFAP